MGRLRRNKTRSRRPRGRGKAGLPPVARRRRGRELGRAREPGTRAMAATGESAANRSTSRLVKDDPGGRVSFFSHCPRLGRPPLRLRLVFRAGSRFVRCHCRPSVLLGGDRDGALLGPVTLSPRDNPRRRHAISFHWGGKRRASPGHAQSPRGPPQPRGARGRWSPSCHDCWTGGHQAKGTPDAWAAGQPSHPSGPSTARGGRTHPAVCSL